MTAAVPEVVETVGAMSSRRLILDGEVLALRPDGTPLPFQVTMRRFGRKLDVAGLRRTLPLTPFFFDCLLVDGQDLTDDPFSRRADVLAELTAGRWLVPRVLSPGPGEAAAFVEEARRAGHEGVMAKSLDAGYAAGSRTATTRRRPRRTPSRLCGRSTDGRQGKTAVPPVRIHFRIPIDLPPGMPTAVNRSRTARV